MSSLRQFVQLTIILLVILAVSLLVASAFLLDAPLVHAESPLPATDGVIVYLAPGAVAPSSWHRIANTNAYVVRSLSKRSLDALPIVLATEDNPVVHLDDPAPSKLEVAPVLSLEDALSTGAPYLPGGLDAKLGPLSSDPLYSSQWGLPKIKAPDAWNKTKGAGALVAVVDTGVWSGHPDLAGCLVNEGRDFVSGLSSAWDNHGHGTHVAGIVCERENTIGGVGGAPLSQVLPVKVLDKNGSGSHASIAEGIRWAADQGAKVINLSLGGPSDSIVLQDAVRYAWSKGAVIVVAAGNSNSSQPSYPAVYPDVIGVGATTSQDTRASFSNYGVNVDISAPGDRIWSTMLMSDGALTNATGYGPLSGTSMAAPMTSAVAALLFAYHPTWSNSQVRSALLDGADPIGDAYYFGRGRVNAAKSLGGPVPTPVASPVIPGPTPTPPASGSPVALLVALINQERAKAGLPALKDDARLAAAGQFHVDWMARTGCFAHNCPGEPEVYQRMRNAGYPLLSGGENIGKGYRSAQDMVAGWMGSSGHRAAILNTYWPDIGCAFQPNGYHWACEFAKGNESAPLPTATPRPLSALRLQLNYTYLPWNVVDDTYRRLCARYTIPALPMGDERQPVQCTWQRLDPNAPSIAPPGQLPWGWLMTVRVNREAPASAWADTRTTYAIYQNYRGITLEEVP